MHCIVFFVFSSYMTCVLHLKFFLAKQLLTMSKHCQPKTMTQQLSETCCYGADKVKLVFFCLNSISGPIFNFCRQLITSRFLLAASHKQSIHGNLHNIYIFTNGYFLAQCKAKRYVLTTPVSLLPHTKQGVN